LVKRRIVFMKTYLLVTVTCPDRPGIIDRVTEVIVSHSANWEESRMARLGGDFAGIARVSVPPEKADALAKSLRELADDRITVAVKAAEPVGPDARQGHVLCELRLTGADHEGIVHDVTGYLAGQEINVESMETEVVPAPMSGSSLFHMQAQIRIPSAVPLPELETNLQRIAEELGVDIHVRPRREHAFWSAEPDEDEGL
jgi:glycine cleavage system regulatory protein